MKLTSKKIGITELHIREFNNLSEFYNYISTTKENKVFTGKTLQSKHGTYEFTQTYSYEEAINLFKNGWSIMAEELTTKLNKISGGIKAQTKTRAKFDVVGFQASVPRYLQGIPTSMINQKKIIQKQKVITLNKSISYYAGVEVHEIVEHSIKALQIVKKIEAQGTRCNLNVVWGIKDSSMNAIERNILKVRIKSASERLNISKVAFPLVHPSMLRRIGFRYIETSPTFEKHDYTWGYGSPMKDDDNDLQFEGEHFIPRFIHNVDDFVKNFK